MKKLVLSLLALPSFAYAVDSHELDDRVRSTAFQVRVMDIDHPGSLSKAAIQRANGQLDGLTRNDAMSSLQAGGFGTSLTFFTALAWLPSSPLDAPVPGKSVAGVAGATSSSLAAGFLALRKARLNEEASTYALNQDAAEAYTSKTARRMAEMFSLSAGQEAALKSALRRDLEHRVLAYKQAVARGETPDDSLPNPMQVALDVKYQGRPVLAGSARRTVETLVQAHDPSTPPPALTEAQKYGVIALGTKLLETTGSHDPAVQTLIEKNRALLQERAATRRARGDSPASTDEEPGSASAE